ncbi:AraC family transcriptional regulator [Paenibacillus koleovorans]|uniref:AraC family transcriptional regulator n=1 Tax=Paenibacillus koleovorans TaxID=121608 RepID=UPI000FDC439C|nr:AraC family transcriptional regulator [Paenibacillus koleovorans]
MRKHLALPMWNGHPYLCLPESVGWYSDMPEHVVYRDKNTWVSFSIHVVVAGKGYLEVNGEAHSLQRGDAFLYFPMQEQRYYSSREEPWSVRWVHFYGNELHPFLTERGFHVSPLRTLKQLKPWEDAHDVLLRECEEHNFIHVPRLSGLTYWLIAEFIHQSTPLTASKSTEALERIHQLLPEMRRRSAEPFVLEQWAEEAQVSTYYFCKLFRKATQMTPSTFMTMCRMQSAKQLLLEKPDWSVNRIAVHTGYATVSYFHKKFLEHEGMTPLEFRKLFRNDG